MDNKKKILIIIAPKGFQDHEYAIPKEILEKGGFEVATASVKRGECRGAFGARVQAGYAINEADADEYEAVVIIGGQGCPAAYFNNEKIFKLLQDFYEKGKITAAICIAPVVLAQSGILKNKKATVWNEDGKWKPELEKYGAIYADEDVVVDGNVITANGPGTAKKFGRELVKKLNKYATHEFKI